MLPFKNKTNLLVSLGFVCALGAIGVSAHLKVEVSANLAKVVNGSLQTIYETGFVKANPLNPYAVSVMSALKYAVFQQASKGAIVGEDGWLFTTEELEVGPNFYENLQNTAQEVARVDKVMRAHGVKLIPVLVPDKSEVYVEFLDVKRPNEVETRRTYLLTLLAQTDVEVLDATPVLRTHSGQSPSFVKDDTHWSPLGSHAVADLVGAHAIALGIELSPAKVTTVQGPPKKLDGDLLKFVPTGRLRGVFGPTQNQIATFETSVLSEAGLFGDPVVDVALVGTSFSAKADWNFLGFLQEALRADVLNFATEGQGPFAPMQSFLASDTFLNMPPKLVIWEIPVRYTSKDMIK